MNRTSRILLILTFLPLFIMILYSESNSQVAFSEAFQKTIKKIAKEQTKKAVFDWVTKEDPAISIVAQDLIGQIIDCKDEDQIITSNISVITTMLFIYRVQASVEKLLIDFKADTVIKQANAVGWSKEDLVAYSSLYFYYSERLKRNLFVSPYILNMWEVRSKIESFQYKDGKKWVTFVSGQLTKSRHKDLDVTLDVRGVEILRIALLRQFCQDSSMNVTSSFVNALCQEYISENDSLLEWIQIWDSTKSIDRLRPYLFNLVLNPLNKAVNLCTSDSSLRELPFSLRTMQQLVLPFYVFSDSALVWKNVPRYLREEIIANLKLILSDWMANSGKNRWGFGYKVMLSGTYLYTDGNIDFTIFDYLKWGYTGDRWTYYGFIGGFIDPLIKYTLNKEGSRIYLVGAGFSFHNFNLMPALGIPYDDLKKGRYQLGVTFGYNIPLSEIVK